ncbi:threonine synthase [Paenibacillus antri]|uniref:Threonine synthase n=1 Tax=Paenibacillus antri TaxID=2582848 RepID=A0A5R9FY94_9BACL|nr:threonine synthase [Paenibacillus antri]TLS49027.1 threonine synthase [Paenibacillus antri]
MDFWFRCCVCSAQTPFGLRETKCACGGTLLVEYDLERAARDMTKAALRARPASMWRYAELLPVSNPEFIVSLGEGWTPLLRLDAAERALPLGKLWVKREEQNPTGSFKARGMSVALSVAREHGVRKVAVNSNGNAASALAAYAARAGMEAYAFLPKDCPWMIAEECVHYGARTTLVDGFIHDAGKIILDGKAEQGWHHVGTLREPGRAEGKKTMGLELAEQLGWKLPDVIVYPTGGGSGIIGMWSAFRQLRELGWIDGKLPRIVAVQETGCAPIVRAMSGRSGPEAAVDSTPTGMRVPNPPDGQLLVRILRETGGTAVEVSADDIRSAQTVMGKLGVSSSPEGAATWAGLAVLLDRGWIGPDEEVVLFNTSHAMKYWPKDGRSLPEVRSYEDWKKIQP